jgi:cation-transporting P-type ATPase E
MTVTAPGPERGLSATEVAERVAAGRVNTPPRGPDRTTAQIVRANVFNPVNGIMLTLFVLILVAGYPIDGLFVGVVVSNATIGIIQELKARRELQRLELLNAPRARVVRDGGLAEIEVGAVVADDLLDVGPGDQVCVDGTVVVSDGLEVDESLLTGESDTVVKHPGDRLLSGSFVVAGGGRFLASDVGADSYANRLAKEATEFVLVNSELRSGVNRILRWLVVLIPPASLLLLVSLLSAEDRWQDALQGTVAAAVAMVPDGLVLLTSLAFVTGVVALARRHALAKELATVELLARVDTLCLDKTGTITTGEISFSEVVPLNGLTPAAVADAVGAIAATDARPNPTMAAVRAGPAAPEGWEATTVEPFSSARKWAGAAFAGRGTYWIGAPDIVLPDTDPAAREQAREASARGLRVLAVVRADTGDPTGLPEGREAVGLVLLEDTVRPDAREILEFFDRQGVELKIISGDSVPTVVAVAARAGVVGTERHLDARELPDDPEALADVVEQTVVFGRVTPHQKRAMVDALRSRGRVVGMTGDGVNDVLALKRSDMGIAMGSGSAASRAVAQLVLLDNRFASLPEVLAQGRKVINNIERVSNLFVTKATYAVLLTAIIGLQQVPFPFLPRHLTLIGTFSIGVPGFFLAVAANTELVRTGFLPRVLRFSLPAGVISALAAWSVYELARGRADIDLDEARTAATITLLAVGLVVLVVISRPLRAWKVGLAVAMGASYAAVMAIGPLRRFYELHPLPLSLWWSIAAVVLVAGAAVVAVPWVVPGIRPPGGPRRSVTGHSAVARAALSGDTTTG